jgi:hypothetical protein
MRAMREQLPNSAASVGNCASAVLRRREQRRSFLCERRRSRRNHARDARAAPKYKGGRPLVFCAADRGAAAPNEKAAQSLAMQLLAHSSARNWRTAECLGGLLRSCGPGHCGGAQLTRTELVQAFGQQVLKFGDGTPFPEHVPMCTRRLLLFQLRPLTIGT